MPFIFIFMIGVATAPTVYGIETLHFAHKRTKPVVATVPTVYGIET